MKKDRNCGMTPYPIYQGGPGMMAPMPGMGPGMIPGGMNYGAPGYQQPTQAGQPGPAGQVGAVQQEISNINRRIDVLERRISSLENAIGASTPTTYNNTFTDSNYQMI